MKLVGLDIGTNYTKLTSDGKNVLMYPSIVAYGEEKDWSLKGETKGIYVGDQALSIIGAVEGVELYRPIQDGRIIHTSFMELAKYGLKKLNIEPEVVATGLPVKSSKKEREELKSQLEKELKTRVLVFPEPVGTLASMGIDTGVCIDIGFGTTDIIVLSEMEYLRGDTMLTGVDKLYESLEVLIRDRIGIAVSPEEMTKMLLNENYSVGRVRSGKKVSVRREEVLNEYERIMKLWADKIINKTKTLLEGLSTMLLENFVVTGGGVLLPKVFETLQEGFSDIGEIKRPENPMTSNAMGYYALAKTFLEKLEAEKKVEERVVETKVEVKVEEKVERVDEEKEKRDKKRRT
ncbi:MAG: rod shape-determining protein [Archaeoglobaceae archaeon]|nr:rod shape-determining protein [Archaeoglobaceae archaeon]MDW8128294.1 rod shape-determining protein [Archaeoglobaceae archaeon]